MVNSLNNYLVPVLVSVLLHGLLLWVLMSVKAPEPEKKQLKRPNYVKAELVQLKTKVKKAAEKKTTTRKKVDLTKKREEERKKKKRAAEKKRKAEEKRKKQEAEAKRKKREAEKKKKEEAAAKKREKERLAKEAAERERLAFEEALLAEERALIEQENELEARSYIDVLKEKIEQRWSRPPSARKGMRCHLRIEMLPNGQIINVKVTKGSGNAAFDRSAQQAVKSLDRFEEIRGIDSKIFDKYFRRLTLDFNPEDIRL